MDSKIGELLKEYTEKRKALEKKEKIQKAKAEKEKEAAQKTNDNSAQQSNDESLQNNVYTESDYSNVNEGDYVAPASDAGSNYYEENDNNYVPPVSNGGGVSDGNNTGGGSNSFNIWTDGVDGVGTVTIDDGGITVTTPSGNTGGISFD